MSEEDKTDSKIYPFRNQKELNEFHDNGYPAYMFWEWLSNPNAEDKLKHEQLPIPSSSAPPDQLTPGKLVLVFEDYKSQLRALYEVDPSAPGPPDIADIEKFTLYTVYLKGLSEIDMLHVPYEKIGSKDHKPTTQDLAKSARLEQTLALVEDAVKLAGDEPEDRPIPKIRY